MIDEMISDVLEREGGYVDHPADLGGPTNMGITQRTLSTWRGHWVSADDVRALTRDEAVQIYRARYFERPRLDELPGEIQPLMFDMAVNHGPRSAVRMLQRVLNEAGFGPLAVDGLIGRRSLAAARAAQRVMGPYLVNALVDERLAFYRRIVARHPSQRVFLRGWTRRAESFRQSIEEGVA